MRNASDLSLMTKTILFVCIVINTLLILATSTEQYDNSKKIECIFQNDYFAY